MLERFKMNIKIALKSINHKRKKLFRSLRNKVFLHYCWFKYEHKRKKFPQSEIVQAESIAILYHGNGIGDVIVLSGMLNALKNAGKRVYCIGYPKLCDLVEKFILIDGVVRVPNCITLKQMHNLACAFDVICDVSDPDKNLYHRVKILSSFPHKYAIGINQTDRRFYDVNLLRNEEGCHWSDRLAAVSKILGVNIEKYTYSIKFDEQCVSMVRNYINNFSERLLIVFNPCASDKYRSLSDRFVEDTIEFLSKNENIQIFVLNYYNEKVMKRFSGVIFNPFSELDCNLYFAGHADLLITVDTCFVHIGNMFKTNLLCLYNNRLSYGVYDNNIQWGPNYDNAVQVVSTENLKTESGDDLRKLDFLAIRKQLFTKLNLIKKAHV